MYKVFFVSFGKFAGREFKSFDDAKKYVEEQNLKAYIQLGPVIVSNYIPGKGFRDL